MNTLKNYDAEFCGSLPLNFINLIQPHGILLILNKEDLNIIQVSENVKEILGVDPDEILNKEIGDFITEKDLDNLKIKLGNWSTKDKIPLSLNFNMNGGALRFSASINTREKFVMVELEKAEEQEEKSFLEIYQEIKYIVASLKDATSVEEVADIATIEIKRLSGFDRVMIYKFDEDWNGSVIAEAKAEDLDPYMHLRFPASDVPKQARDLYFKNPYRIIPNVDFTPARLIPIINPASRSFTDLSECTLRSVPSVHIEYLRNMKVKASMSTAIIIDNQLWGLISCHHKEPKYLNYPFRAAFELMATMISLQLSAKENERKLSFKTVLNDINYRLLERVLTGSDIYSSLFSGSPNLLDLLSLTGAAVSIDGDYKIIGETPNKEEVEDVFRWIEGFGIDKVFTTTSLSTLYESEAFKDVASGMIVIPLSPKDKEYIIGFRKEVVQSIMWGGNPNEAVNFEEDGKTYHPRNSFSKYKEQVEGISDPWLPQEIEVAEKLRTCILERLLIDKT